MKQFLETGEIVNTHGIRGEVKLLPWADDPEFLLEFDEVYIDGRTYEIESARVQKTCVLMKFKGINTVEDAIKLRGKVVSIDRTDIELAEGSYFIADLIGLPVFADGVEIGKIKEVLTPPGNDVYVVRGKHEYMIPVVQEFVLDVDLEQGVQVRLIEGMQTDAD